MHRWVEIGVKGFCALDSGLPTQGDGQFDFIVFSDMASRKGIEGVLSTEIGMMAVSLVSVYAENDKP